MYQSNKKFHHINQVVSIFAAGGFAQTNKLLMYVESIKILLSYHVSEKDIKQSWWYKEFTKEVSEESIQYITLLKKENKQLKSLHEEVRKFKQYSIFKHPFKKYSQLIHILQKYKGK